MMYFNVFTCQLVESIYGELELLHLRHLGRGGVEVGIGNDCESSFV